jgi:dihydropteroate synthase
MIWKTRRTEWDLSRRGEIMGILNVTPDSFSDGGRHADFLSAMEHARRMIAEGAAILDVGGESTRPGASPVEAGEEMRRVVPVVKELRAEWDGMISVDTSKALVAAAALEAGADIVNDVTGLSGDPAMAGVCRDAGCGVVVMHMQGEPRTMQAAPSYHDVVAEVAAYFVRRLDGLLSAGLDERTICVDPGIGFGKTTEHNLALLRATERLAPPGRPLLLGVSRKSFLGKVLGTDSLEARDWPTVALTAWTRATGVRIWRVHEVRRNVEALRMAEAILGA